MGLKSFFGGVVARLLSLGRRPVQKGDFVCEGLECPVTITVDEWGLLCFASLFVAHVSVCVWTEVDSFTQTNMCVRLCPFCACSSCLCVSTVCLRACVFMCSCVFSCVHALSVYLWVWVCACAAPMSCVYIRACVPLCENVCVFMCFHVPE